MVLKLATVFSGIGAVEHALKRMNIPHELVFACDIDKFVKESFFANYNIDESRWFEDIDDIKGVVSAKFRNKVDLLVGGSPCQSFSIIGRRKGLEDPRGLLIYEFTRLVKELRPKVFIYENVKGILNHGNSETWEEVKKKFNETGYTYYPEIINAKDHGIPQHRERLFVVGFREDNLDFEFPESKTLNLKMQDFLEDSPNPKYFLPEKGIKFVTKEKNIKKKYTQINGDIALCQKANQQFNWHGDFVMEKPKEIDEKYFLSDKIANYVTSSGTNNSLGRDM